jgi:hypothetical protein
VEEKLGMGRGATNGKRMQHKLVLGFEIQFDNQKTYQLTHQLQLSEPLHRQNETPNFQLKRRISS